MTIKKFKNIKRTDVTTEFLKAILDWDSFIPAIEFVYKEV